MRRIALLSPLVVALGAMAQTNCVTLAWNASTATNVVGYKVYYGGASRDYTNSVDEGDATNATICGLVNGTTYYFAVTAYDSFGLESDFSNEIGYTVPSSNGPPTVVLTSPANGSGYVAPATIALGATVTTNNNPVTGVQFYNGTNLLGTSTTAPFTFNWSAVPVGSYNVYAVVLYGLSGSVASGTATVSVTNVPPTVALTSPANGANYAAPATIAFAATVTTNGNTISKVQFYNGSTLLGSDTTAPYTFNWTNVAAGNYPVSAQVVYGSGSTVASPTLSVTVHPLPVISVISNQATYLNTATAPIPFTVTDAETSASNVSLTAASGNPTLVSVANIVFGGSGSSRTVTITPSANQSGIASITIIAAYGVASSSNTFKLEIAASKPPPPTLISVTGSGTFTPNLNAMTLVPGASYTVTAIPGVGQKFGQWSGGVNSTNTTITFVYSNGMAINASFLPTPYFLAPGTYSGLFYDTNQVTPTSAGSFAFLVTQRGTYSGHVLLGGERLLFAGKFNVVGHATNPVARLARKALNLSLDLGAGAQANQVTGTLTDGSWLASLLGNRAVFNARTNPAPAAGLYTLILPGQSAPLPEGDGYGSVSVSKAGVVLFSGKLGDGFPVTQGAWLASNGNWPFYLSLYGGMGLAAGWLDFTNEVNDDLTGPITWTRPTSTHAHYFPTGFTNQFQASGSLYVPPVTKGQRILNITNALVAVSGGDLSTGLTNVVSMSAMGSCTNLSPNPLTMTLWPGRGLVTGTSKDPVSGAPIYFSGAVFQKLNTGYGMHLGTNQSSQVFIQAY